MEQWVPYKWGISWLAEKLSAIQEVLCSMELIVGTSWPASVKFIWVSIHDARVFDVRIFAWRLRTHMMPPSVTLLKRATRRHMPEGKPSQTKASEPQVSPTNYCWYISFDRRVSTAPGDGKEGISGSLMYTHLSSRELSVTKTIECSLGTATLYWCACQVNELSRHWNGLMT
jgi:hypothetical protein